MLSYAISWSLPNTVFHRSIAAATNYFVLQVPERLFEGGDTSRAASISSSTPNFLAAFLLVLCSAQFTALSLNAAS